MNVPAGIDDSPAQELWNKIRSHSNSVYVHSFTSSEERTQSTKHLMQQRCVLYFPSNRFEAPAWLNEANLTASPHRTREPDYEGQTARQIVATSTLRSNQDWLYDVVTDSRLFELREQLTPLPSNGESEPVLVRVFAGYSGAATYAFNQALQLLRVVVQDPQARFGLDPRPRRNISIYSQDVQRVPNVFQLSSGETSLLDLGLSVLRDADMSAGASTSVADIRGIAVIDEVDLHLHAVHQYEVLPSLVKIFPKVQFIVTTHSPLFVLGMQREFGDDGFTLHRMPEGDRIGAEEFSEFGSAYSAFRSSQAFDEDIRKAIRTTVKPVLVVEGKTDQKYLKRAAALIRGDAVLQGIELVDGGGAPNLKKLWERLSRLPDETLDKTLGKHVLLLLDCDETKTPADKERLHLRIVPFQPDNPIKKGIENLLPIGVLKRAIAEKPALIDVRNEHRGTTRGEEVTIPAEWTVNEDEKMNLCNWICENGTAEDFAGFGSVLDLIGDMLNAEEQ